LAEFATDFFVGLFDCIRPARKCKTFSTVFVDIFLFSSTRRERRTETAADAPSEPPPVAPPLAVPLLYSLFPSWDGGAQTDAQKFPESRRPFQQTRRDPRFPTLPRRKKRFKK
jgi:hypothetical protein